MTRIRKNISLILFGRVHEAGSWYGLKAADTIPYAAFPDSAFRHFRDDERTAPFGTSGMTGGQ
jgi:hypothetical protein